LGVEILPRIVQKTNNPKQNPNKTTNSKPS
jgi:hypothetical protein